MTDTLTLILICGFTFLVGIGIGAAVTDAIHGWQPKPKHSKNTQSDLTSK